MAPILADAIVSVLLIAVIVYGVILERRLSGFRKNRAEIEQLSKDLMSALGRAESGLENLKVISHEVGTALHEKVTEAQQLRDEFLFIIERADALAEKLAADVIRRTREAKAIENQESRKEEVADTRPIHMQQQPDQPLPQVAGSGRNDLLSTLENLR